MTKESSAPGLIAIDPGPLATIQDRGRLGWQRFGVSPAGAADTVSLALANLLVGNEPTVAAVEFTVIGGTWEIASESARIAVAGSGFGLSIDGRPVPSLRSYTLRRSQRLTIGPAADAIRGYLALAGGFALDPVLGSLSTHLRSALGGFAGRAIAAGDLVPVVRPSVEVGGDRALASRPSSPAAPIFEARPLRVVVGPQDDQFSPAAIAILLGHDYKVTREADRMGCRLSGPPIPHLRGHNIISDGIAAGSIQVPGSAQPILLLVDRQTTGGYPKIATVISADLPRAGQLRPGDRVRFAAVSLAEARVAARAASEALADLARRLGPVEPWSGNHLDAGRLLGLNLIGGVVNGAAPADS
ncbi:MAG: biotin-dependent carboxyltransferase family protein [Alphaproteobacteria bacterium]|nr:biotin-dependent carboxyltransferase family protein [Alphaproteobacteria bacterium]